MESYFHNSFIKVQFLCELCTSSFFQGATQLQHIEDSEPVVDGSHNRWHAVQ